MTLTIQHVFLLFAIVCAVITIMHEFFWWRKSGWKQATGVVIKIVGVSDSSHPIIEYLHEGEKHEFKSSYGGSACPEIGDRIGIVYNPKTFEAEFITFTNRWIFTLIPLLFAVIFAYFSAEYAT